MLYGHSYSFILNCLPKRFCSSSEPFSFLPRVSLVQPPTWCPLRCLAVSKTGSRKSQELGLAFGETITCWAGCTIGNTHRWINQLNRVWNTCPVVQNWNLFVYCVFALKICLMFNLCSIFPKGSRMVCHILCKNSSLLVWHLSLGALRLGEIEFEDSCLLMAVLWLLKHCCS